MSARIGLLSLMAILATPLLRATTPTVTVLSPVAVDSATHSAGNFQGTSPVHYVAYASSSDCFFGISSIQIYSAGTLAYSSFSSYLDVQLPLSPNFYHTEVKAWDNCGGVSSVSINGDVEESTGQVVVTSPISNLLYQPGDISFTATATTVCPQGVAALGVYTAPGQRAVTQGGNSLGAGVTLSVGTYHVVVEEWDNCGGAATTPLTVTVGDGGIPSENLQFAYIPDAAKGMVDGLWLSSSTCAMTPVLGNPAPAHFKPVAVARNFPYLFVLNQDSRDISIYRMDLNVTGELTQIPGSPFSLNEASGYNPTGLVVPGTGIQLGIYVTNINSDPAQGGTITELSFDETSGKVTAMPGSPLKLQGNVQPTGISVGPIDINEGHYLFTTNGSSISVLGGTDFQPRSEVDGSPFLSTGRFGPSSGVQDIAIVGHGSFPSFLYTANSENSISAFQISRAGQLTPITGSPFDNPDNPNGTTGNPVSIAVEQFSAGPRFLYALNSGSQDIAIFSLDANSGAPIFVTSQHQGRIITAPEDRLRIGANFPQQCLATSNGYAMAIDDNTGMTTLEAGSPFLAPGSRRAIDIGLF